MAKAGREEKRKDALHYLRIVIAVLLTAFVILALFFAFRLGTLVFSKNALTQKKGEHRSYTLEVAKGESVLAVGRELEKNGIIESGVAFFLQSKIFQCRIAPGTYQLSSSVSSREILKTLHQEWQKQEAMNADDGS